MRSVKIVAYLVTIGRADHIPLCARVCTSMCARMCAYEVNRQRFVDRYKSSAV